MKCRHCAAALELELIDLGSAPLSNAYLEPAALAGPETWYPLRVLVCEACWLVQTADVVGGISPFDENYAYFSSYSSSWLAHAEGYVAAMAERFSLGPDRHVVEVAANDGYLLQYVAARGIPCTGIEPTSSTAAAARQKGLRMVEDFFGTRLARELVSAGPPADLIAANNVLAHVPDINDFVSGFAILLAPDGIATFEFPHLLCMLEENQFDTIYHEHYSYLSFTTVVRIFTANGLDVFDVEQLPTHGGSLRVYAQRQDQLRHGRSRAVVELLERERAAGLTDPSVYAGFRHRAARVKNEFIGFLLAARNSEASVAAYGAAAKGNTLMNYAGVRSDLIPYVVDRNPAKQGRYMPGSRIRIVAEEWLRQTQPEYVVILPWNLAAEIRSQLAYVSEWDGKFVTAVPRLEVAT